MRLLLAGEDEAVELLTNEIVDVLGLPSFPVNWPSESTQICKLKIKVVRRQVSYTRNSTSHLMICLSFIQGVKYIFSTMFTINMLKEAKAGIFLFVFFLSRL